MSAGKFKGMAKVGEVLNQPADTFLRTGLCKQGIFFFAGITDERGGQIGQDGGGDFPAEPVLHGADVGQGFKVRVLEKGFESEAMFGEVDFENGGAFGGFEDGAAVRLAGKFTGDFGATNALEEKGVAAIGEAVVS